MVVVVVVVVVVVLGGRWRRASGCRRRRDWTTWSRGLDLAQSGLHLGHQLGDRSLEMRQGELQAEAEVARDCRAVVDGGRLLAVGHREGGLAGPVVREAPMSLAKRRLAGLLGPLEDDALVRDVRGPGVDRGLTGAAAT